MQKSFCVLYRPQSYRRTTTNQITTFPPPRLPRCERERGGITSEICLGRNFEFLPHVPLCCGAADLIQLTCTNGRRNIVKVREIVI